MSPLKPMTFSGKDRPGASLFHLSAERQALASQSTVVGWWLHTASSVRSPPGQSVRCVSIRAGSSTAPSNETSASGAAALARLPAGDPRVPWISPRRQLARWSWGYWLIVLLLVAAAWDMVFKPGL